MGNGTSCNTAPAASGHNTLKCTFNNHKTSRKKQNKTELFSSSVDACRSWEWCTRGSTVKFSARLYLGMPPESLCSSQLLMNRRDQKLQRDVPFPRNDTSALCHVFQRKQLCTLSHLHHAEPHRALLGTVSLSAPAQSRTDGLLCQKQQRRSSSAPHRCGLTCCWTCPVCCSTNSAKRM